MKNLIKTHLLLPHVILSMSFKINIENNIVGMSLNDEKKKRL